MTSSEFGALILAVTSQVRPVGGVGEAAIAQWKDAGLLRPSVLKPILATIDRSLVLPTLGRLADEDRAALRKVLGEILGA
jgi:mRNA interferase MazF